MSGKIIVAFLIFGVMLHQSNGCWSFGGTSTNNNNNNNNNGGGGESSSDGDGNNNNNNNNNREMDNDGRSFQIFFNYYRLLPTSAETPFLEAKYVNEIFSLAKLKASDSISCYY